MSFLECPQRGKPPRLPLEIALTALRLPYPTLSPEAYQGFIATKKALTRSSLGRPLVELVYLRVSQINGCAFCLEMHSAALREGGAALRERVLRLRPRVLAVLGIGAGWRVSAHFSDRERAALAWAESLTDVARTHAPDEDFAPLTAHFSDAEIADLTFAVALMGAFNRLAIGMRQ